jgi:hypothetical protein
MTVDALVRKLAIEKELLVVRPLSLLLNQKGSVEFTKMVAEKKQSVQILQQNSTFAVKILAKISTYADLTKQSKNSDLQEVS